jgi:hypothetical protein
MAGANTEVQDALETALSDTAASQAASGSSPEVAEALDQALKSGTEEKPDSASERETNEGTEDTDKGSKTVPYERLSQVVRQKNEISERFTTLEDQFKAVTARETELRGRVGDMEQDSQILDAIKNLAQDEKYRDHVVAIDKALQGIDDEIETAVDKGDDKAVSGAEKRLEAKTAELEDLLSDQKAERLWDEASAQAKEMLAALPAAYTDEDRVIVGKLWTPRVDWSGIEETGSDAIRPALTSSLAEVIKEYGTPRGALVAKTTEEIESRIPEARIVSPEDAIKGLLETDWAATDDDGKAAISDDDFSRGMADLLRKTRGA